MDGIMLKYDGESGTWKKAKAPYMSIDIPTKEDFEELNKVLQAYYNNTAHVKHGCCDACGHDVVNGGGYCWHCGRRFVEEDE